MLDTLRRRAALRPDHAEDQAALVLLAADVALARGRTAEASTALGKRAGDSATARAAYSAPINQWKGVDVDLPPLVAARRELARLQAASGR